MAGPKARKTTPKKQPLAEALEEAMVGDTKAPEVQIAIDPNMTNLVRQFVTDQISTLLPAQQAVMRETFNKFMQRLVVLAPQQ